MKILGVDCGYDITNFDIEEPVLRCVRRQADFLIYKPFQYHWYCNGLIRVRNSPADWNTDLASVPALVCAANPHLLPHKLIKIPAIAHDDLYGNRPMFDGIRISRGEADALLWFACIEEGLSHSDADEVYMGVRIGGSGIWHAHDEYFAALDGSPIAEDGKRIPVLPTQPAELLTVA